MSSMNRRPLPASGPAAATYLHWLDATARHRRDDIAVADPVTTLTYGELLERSQRAAAHLLDAGLQRAQPVCFAMAPSADYVSWIFGCLLAGGVTAPVNTRLSVTEVAAYTARLRPALVVADSDHAHLFARAGGSHPDPIVAVTVGPANLERSAGHRHRHAAPTIEEHLEALDERAPAIIFPTGGTTGLPKGAFTDHRGLLLWTWHIACGGRRHANETELYFSPAPVAATAVTIARSSRVGAALLVTSGTTERSIVAGVTLCK